jgi:hypothetical protein
MPAFLNKVPGERYLYFNELQDKKGGKPLRMYYFRNRDVCVSLETTNLKQAGEMRDAKIVKLRQVENGEVPKVTIPPLLLSIVLSEYELAKFPDRQGNPQDGVRHLRSVKGAIPNLIGFFGKMMTCARLRRPTHCTSLTNRRPPAP